MDAPTKNIPMEAVVAKTAQEPRADQPGRIEPMNAEVNLRGGDDGEAGEICCGLCAAFACFECCKCCC